MSDFFRELLYYYGIRMNHLNPNSILQLSIFIHLCEDFLGIPPSICLFRYFFKLKLHPHAANPDVVGGAGFQFRVGRKTEFLTYTLRDSKKNGKSKWFYSGNVLPSLETHVVDTPWVNPYWDQENMSLKEFEALHPHIKQIVVLRRNGLIGEGVKLVGCDAESNPCSRG